jgi:two-component system, NarL family, response regulator DesR
VIRVFLAFDDPSFGQQLFEYLNEQPDFRVCGKVEIRDEVVREAIQLRPDIAILEMAAEDDLEVANAFKQHIPDLPLLLVAEEVSLETEKKALAHGVDAVFPKQDDPTALALNVRALYDLMGRDRENHS